VPFFFSLYHNLWNDIHILIAFTLRTPGSCKQPVNIEDGNVNDKWWDLYDSLWIIISEMNGKGPSKLPKSSPTAGPSFGQRARGLVESLNIPAAEVAAVVVSGGIGSALGSKPNKNIDKAMLLRGERCPRIIFRLVILYLCKSSLERASRCVQQVIPLLPFLLAADDEQSKSRLQLFIWYLCFSFIASNQVYRFWETKLSMLMENLGYTILIFLVYKIINMNVTFS
jgi:hypothetical protein